MTKQIHRKDAILILNAIYHAKDATTGIRISPFASSISSTLGMELSATIHRLKRLCKIGYLKCEYRQYSLTPEGEKYLLDAMLQDSRGHQIASTNQTSSVYNRLHALRITFKIFPTEYERLEAKLTNAGISYKINNVRNYKQYIVQWGEHQLHITTRKIIDYAPDNAKPFDITGREILDESLKASVVAVTHFIDKTQIRVLEEDGRIWFKPTYYEIAITNDETAHEVTVGRRYVPLAYDRLTGKVVLWADKSLYPVPESETNKLPIHALLQDFYQAMVDGKWRWQIEQQARLEDKKLLHDTIVALNETSTTLKEYGEKLNLHLPVLDSMLKAQQSQEQKDKATTEVMLRLMEATNKLSAKIDAIATKPKPSVWLRMKNAIKRLININK